jgi:hypothetical protein
MMDEEYLKFIDDDGIFYDSAELFFQIYQKHSPIYPRTLFDEFIYFIVDRPSGFINLSRT